METKEQRRERLAKALWEDECSIRRTLARREGLDIADAWSKPWETLSSQQSYWGRKADAIIASDEAAGLVVVPVEPTGEMLKAGSAALGALEYPTEDSNPWYQMEIKFGLHAPDCAVSYAAMIAAAKEQT